MLRTEGEDTLFKGSPQELVLACGLSVLQRGVAQRALRNCERNGRGFEPIPREGAGAKVCSEHVRRVGDAST